MILTGIRIVLVQSIGLVTVAALIGGGGFGTFVFQGIGQTAMDLVLLGAVPTVALAFSAAVLLDAAVDLSRRGARMIELEGLTKRYDARTVVDDVSMTIPSGSVCVMVGTSGSGKSTVLRMINRLVTPSAGRVLIDGEDTAAVPEHELRRRIGYAIQGHGLFPHRTVAENIATVPGLLGWPKARIDARVEELLDLFQLDPAEFARKFPHQLSGGQQQRVGVARALAAEPNILLMDEPFGALDAIIRGRAQDDLLAIQRRFKTTIVLVTHDMEEAFHLGDRIAVLSEGRLLQYAEPASHRARPGRRVRRAADRHVPTAPIGCCRSRRRARCAGAWAGGRAGDLTPTPRCATPWPSWSGQAPTPCRSADDGARLGRVTLDGDRWREAGGREGHPADGAAARAAWRCSWRSWSRPRASHRCSRR